MKQRTIKFGVAVFAIVLISSVITSRAIAVPAPVNTNASVSKPADDNPLNFTAPPQKKLLEYGWDQYFNANPAYIRDNIREMEKRPFDGIIFRLADGGGQVFDISKWDEAKLSPQLKIVSDIKWGKFTDNFVYLLSASTMDWASDEDWKKVVAHTRFCARAARIAKCKGIVFDPEAYGFDPWIYSKQKHANTMSFNQYEKLVRKRGAQFMQALQSEMPNAVIPMFHLFQSSHGAMGMGDSSKIVDPAKRNDSLNGFLFIAFLNGMLDVMKPGIQLIDGNEQSYYYESARQFYQATHIMHQSVKIYVAAENQAKFDRQVRAGHALYVDHVFNTRPPISRSGPSIHMTPEERSQWFEHNVYYALEASDGYAWLYSESMNWWKNENLPPGLEAATVAARAKIAEGKPLGFDFDAILRGVQERKKAQLAEGLTRRTARIAKIVPTQVPKIDGVLDDDFYKSVAPEPNFIGYFSLVKPGEKARVATQAWLGYDERNLYVAFRCEETNTKELKIVGSKRDDNVWDGDDIEISLSQPLEGTALPLTAESLYFHFIVNPRGTFWDAKSHGSTNDATFNANVDLATRIGDGEWSAEIAIPWSELEAKAPQPGSKIFANLARYRIGPDNGEGTSWSQFVGNFLEPENFGTWQF